MRLIRGARIAADAGVERCRDVGCEVALELMLLEGTGGCLVIYSSLPNGRLLACLLAAARYPTTGRSWQAAVSLTEGRTCHLGHPDSYLGSCHSPIRAIWLFSLKSPNEPEMYLNREMLSKCHVISRRGGGNTKQGYTFDSTHMSRT